MTSFPYLLLKGDNPLKPFAGKNLWSNPVSECGRPTSRSSRHCSSEKSYGRKRPESNFRTFTSSQLQHLKTEVDPEIIHELPYKDHLIARAPPEKLDKLIKAIELEKNPNYPKFRYKQRRQENRDMRSYLSYLGSGSNSNQSISTFRQRMVDKSETEDRQLQVTEDLGSQWVKNFLPPELTLKKSKTRGTLANLNVMTQGSSDSMIGTELDGAGFITQSKASISSPMMSPKRVRWNRPAKFTMVEEVPDIAAAQKLSDEVAANYRMYKEKANKNRELQQQMTEYLHYAGVLKIFLGKIQKKLSLSARIYLQLVENPDIVERPSLVEDLDKSPKMKRPPQIFLRPKVNQTKFDLYKRINEKLQDANIEFKVQGLQTLENNLIQAHSDFRVQKMKAVKQLIFSGNHRMKNIISECYNTEEMIPIHQANPIHHEDFNYDDLALEGMPKAQKEIRMVSSRLTKVLRNWQQTLLSPEPR